MFTVFGIIDMPQRRGPVVLRQPVMLGVKLGLYMLTECFVNITLQL